MAPVSRRRSFGRMSSHASKPKPGPLIAPQIAEIFAGRGAVLSADLRSRVAAARVRPRRARRRCGFRDSPPCRRRHDQGRARCGKPRRLHSQCRRRFRRGAEALRALAAAVRQRHGRTRPGRRPLSQRPDQTASTSAPPRNSTATSARCCTPIATAAIRSAASLPRTASTRCFDCAAPGAIHDWTFIGRPRSRSHLGRGRVRWRRKRSATWAPTSSRSKAPTATRRASPGRALARHGGPVYGT